MRSRRFDTRFVTALAVYLLLTMFVSGCASSLSVKQKASNTHQSVHTALITLDDFERTVCLPAPSPNSNHCTRTPAILTDVQHQQFSRLMVQAYDADIKVARAIISWEPCLTGTGKNGVPCTPTPPPTDVASLKGYVDQLITITTTLTGPPNSDVAKFIELTRSVLNSVLAVESAFKGTTSEQVTPGPTWTDVEAKQPYREEYIATKYPEAFTAAKTFAAGIPDKTGATGKCWLDYIGPDGYARAKCPEPFSPYGVVWFDRCVLSSWPEPIRNKNQDVIACGTKEVVWTR